MNITIPTTKNKIYKQYLHILNPILSTRKLTNIEIEVLSTLLYINDLYKHLPKVQRDQILFHKETREKIRLSIKNISKFSYNNVLSSLRKKQVISKRTLLITVPIINNQVTINYTLKLT